MPRYFPDLEEFEGLVLGGAQVVPVWRQLLADRLTPVTAFELLGDAAAHAFLLESVQGGEFRGRYSIIGLKPDLVWRVRDPSEAPATAPSGQPVVTTGGAVA